MTALADSAFVVKARGQTGDMAERIVEVTLNNNYDAAGWLCSSRQLGLGGSGEIVNVDPGAGVDGYLLSWDQTNKKLRVHQGDNPNVAAAPNVELAGASAVMNAKKVRLHVLGKGHG